MKTRPVDGGARPARRRVRAWHIVLAVVVMVTPFLLVRLLAGPDFVARITIVNPTAYDLRVQVNDGRGGGWLLLTTVPSEDRAVVTDVVDQGEVWVFAFAGQGRDGGELTVTRAELAASDWQITIPERVGAELEAKGAAPSP